jgi:putative ABC transport system permease protein
MLKNYFKISLRSLNRNKGYTLINILGLATGIAVCLLIFLIIRFETSFDNFHQKRDRIYRILTEYHHADSKDIFYGRGVPLALPRGMKTFKQVEEVVPLMVEHNDQILVLNNKQETVNKFKEENGIFYSVPELFKVFDFPILSGSYESLKDPGNALVTKEVAEKYFGDWTNAIGKTLKINNLFTIKITGVLGNTPVNTDLPLKMVIAYGTSFSAGMQRSTNWDNTMSDFGCFILLSPGASPLAFNSQLIAYSKKVKSPENKDLQTIQTLKDVHFDTQAGNFGGKTISRKSISALWLIAAFILLIACVNFTNLSTAQAVNRAKEVGVRKVMGSHKWQLQVQFLSETFLIVVASVFASLFITWLALPFINRILEISLSVNLTNALTIITFLVVLSVMVTALAGFYPSIVLSGFNPIQALKSKLAAKSVKGISLRRGLVVFQFIIAQSLIIATLVISKQMTYFTSQPLGFDKSAVVNIPVPTDSVSIRKFDFLKKQLKSVNGIQNVSFDSNTPVEDNNDDWTNVTFDHATKQTDFYSIIKWADEEYVPGYKLPLVAGRNITASDTVKEFLVNEMFLKKLGIRNVNNALQKEISFSETTKGTIVGVLKDFNTRSFRDDLAPMIITSYKNGYTEASVKLNAGELTGSMHSIEKIWNTTFPDFVFEYKFLDAKVESFYKQENQLSELNNLFALVAIFLSCLGLYGLASFMAVQRIKEVGIRKVLGATGAHIVYLFSKEFVLLICIAFVIATPLTWYFMNQWLQNYPFRIELNGWLFLTGGALSILIALATVSFQAIRAASANPVTSLRSE